MLPGLEGGFGVWGLGFGVLGVGLQKFCDGRAGVVLFSSGFGVVGVLGLGSSTRVLVSGVWSVVRGFGA